MFLRIKNILIDFYNFILIVIYWTIGVMLLLVARFFDRFLGTKIFRYLDKIVRKLA